MKKNEFFAQKKQFFVNDVAAVKDYVLTHCAQDQIDKIGGKGQNGREPQQRYKKRYPYNGNKQILFCFWFHAKILSRRFVAAGCKKTVCGLFIVFLKNSACQNGILVRCSLRMLLVYL